MNVEDLVAQTYDEGDPASVIAKIARRHDNIPQDTLPVDEASA